MRSLTDTQIKIPKLNKTIPVSVVSTHKSNTPKFSKLCPKNHKIKMQYYCPVCDKSYEFKELKIGYKLGDKYVEVPKETKIFKPTPIQIKEFVDPKFTPLDIKNIYYLLPKDINKNYTLILNVLKKYNKMGIGKFVFRNKEHIVGIAPYKNTLILLDFYEKDEIIDAPEFQLPKLSNEEIEIGSKILDLQEEVSLEKEITKRLEKALENPKEVVKEVKTELESDLLAELKKKVIR